MYPSLENSTTHITILDLSLFKFNLFEISFNLQFQDEEDITERIAAPESGGISNGNIEIETVFGPKIRRRKKKMETRLLKEILSDFSFTKRNKGKTDFHCFN